MSSHERALRDEANNVTYQRCQYAYEWCIPYITGKKVLDTGCGLGYGADYMSAYAAEVVGIDYDNETIEQNRKTYADKKNISFVQGSIPPLPFPDNSFDVVTSFQFIEHIHHRKEFIKECLRVVKPGGQVLITTPNIKRSLARNPFHIHEYTFDEMKGEVSIYTKNFETLGLNATERVRRYYEENGKFVRMILKWDILGLHKILPAKILFIPYNWITSLMRNKLKEKVSQTAAITTDDFFLQKENLDDCWDIFVVASKA
jgi:ubiquinone/menaquinone biosynthesis C-methylase UbiE